MKTILIVGAVLTAIVAAVSTYGVFVAGWDTPPIKSEQWGFRGVGMAQFSEPEEDAELVASNVVPEPPYDPDPSGIRASEAYENVQVLGHLSADQFNRIMLSITEWVVPADVRSDPNSGGGCNYCHNPQNLASDEVYTKNVTRRMFQMTWDINEGWTKHVQNTGVTCYTCHRGNGVPQYVWAKAEAPSGNMNFSQAAQNTAGENVGLSSLPYDPFSAYLEGSEEIRLATDTVLPTGNEQRIENAEKTYALMIHMSESLGVNCTYCHNSRAWASWELSTPQRVTAWHGIRMARHVNNEYLNPLSSVFPDVGPDGMPRKGPYGDTLKTNCTTCHQGLAKPLNGQPMAADYPELQSGPYEQQSMLIDRN